MNGSKDKRDIVLGWAFLVCSVAAWFSLALIVCAAILWLAERFIF